MYVFVIILLVCMTFRSGNTLLLHTNRLISHCYWHVNHNTHRVYVRFINDMGVSWLNEFEFGTLTVYLAF